MEQLNHYVNIPLEREYEGWITSQMERYFETLGINYFLRAYSSKEEKHFPVDELLTFNDSFKIIGIQFKRPTMRGRKRPQNAIEDLKWELGNPSHQFDHISTYTNIYYCLPTFTNRNFRNNSLALCRFWRPSGPPKSKTFYLSGKNEISNSFTWPDFIRKILACEIGSKTDIIGLKEIKREILIPQLLNDFNKTEIDFSTSDGEEDNPIYLLGIEMPAK